MGQENVTGAMIIERNIGLAGEKVCNMITIDSIKIYRLDKNM